jgi:hypothetical protein
MIPVRIIPLDVVSARTGIHRPDNCNAASPEWRSPLGRSSMAGNLFVPSVSTSSIRNSFPEIWVYPQVRWVGPGYRRSLGSRQRPLAWLGNIEIGQAELHGASDLSSPAIRWWATLIVPAESDGQSSPTTERCRSPPAIRSSLDLWLSRAARLGEKPSCESLRYPNRNAVSC